MFFQVVFLALLALLPMVNPPTTATLLLGLSKGMSREHVRRQVNMAAIYLFCTLCITFFIGSSILDLFGISIPGLRLAGGAHHRLYRLSHAVPRPQPAERGRYQPEHRLRTTHHAQHVRAGHHGAGNKRGSPDCRAA